MKWKKVFCKIIRQLLKITNHHGFYRTRHCGFRRISILYVYGEATRGGRSLRNNYMSRLRGGKNWDELYVASGLNVPRSGCLQRFIPIQLLNSAFQTAGFLSSFTAMISHFESSQTKPQKHRHSTVSVTARRRRHHLSRTTRVWNILDGVAQGRFGF